MFQSLNPFKSYKVRPVLFFPHEYLKTKAKYSIHLYGAPPSFIRCPSIIYTAPLHHLFLTPIHTNNISTSIEAFSRAATAAQNLFAFIIPSLESHQSIARCSLTQLNELRQSEVKKISKVPKQQLVNWNPGSL